MMSEEFKDYYNEVMKTVSTKTNNIPYAKNLVEKNYFRIKTGFYEDENPDKIVEELVFQIVEHLKERKGLILENTNKEFMLHPVRRVVRNLVDIIKSENSGKHNLPEDITDGDEIEYNFKNIPYFDVEFKLDFDYNINDEYKIDGVLFNEELTISIVLIINPKYYPQSLYDIIADLNDIVAHEIEHIYQESWMRPEDELDEFLGKETERPVGKEYYLQRHEIPAEFKGFDRVRKLRKEKLSKTIRDWFIRNKNVHNLSNYDIDEVTNELLKIFKEKYNRS